MKKLLLLMVAALSIMFTQCKKTEVSPATPVTPAAEGGVNITLSVDGGSKVLVTPDDGKVKFESGDVIYVASNGKYVGTLTHDGTKFAGTISKPTVGQPLFFYFLGNKTPETELEAGTTTSIAVSITDQSMKLPVISAAESRESYSSYTTNYTATLLNKCGLVKFSATGYTGSGTITVKKMNNKVTVDLSKNLGDGAFTNSKDGEGLITLNKVGGDYWAILLPQVAVTGGAEGDAYSSDSWFGTYGTVCAISDNSYVNTSVAVTLAQIGIGTFSVGASTTVSFSPGNLYYNGADDSHKMNSALPSGWNFYGNQYDYCNYGSTATENKEISLFTWGYGSWSTTYNTTTYQTGNTFTDWGSQSISGYPANTWRTLTSAEWVYLLNVSGSEGRTQTNRFAKANVNGVKGLLVFPDGYSGTTSGTGIAEVNKTDSAYPGSSILDATWTTMQSSGVVFLPAAGLRDGESVDNVGSSGHYWSSSPNTSGEVYAYYLNFYSDGVTSKANYYRTRGYCVRLVR